MLRSTRVSDKLHEIHPNSHPKVKYKYLEDSPSTRTSSSPSTTQSSSNPLAFPTTFRFLSNSTIFTMAPTQIRNSAIVKGIASLLHTSLDRWENHTNISSTASPGGGCVIM